MRRQGRGEPPPTNQERARGGGRPPLERSHKPPLCVAAATLNLDWRSGDHFLIRPEQHMEIVIPLKQAEESPLEGGKSLRLRWVTLGWRLEF